MTTEVKLDIEVWINFLSLPEAYCRPFSEFYPKSPYVTDFHTDASGNHELGAGGHCGKEWFVLQWNPLFMKEHDPSIDYLELYAVTIGVTLWLERFRNQHIIIFCDNLAVVHMLNNSSSSCGNCMLLIRLIVFKMLQCNTRITAAHVRSRDNLFADLLSRFRYDQFRIESRKIKKVFSGHPRSIPTHLWPMEQIWSDSLRKQKLHVANE